jgi:glycosyltransferase involved in cell wall biosynthesis
MINIVFASHNGARTLPRMLEALSSIEVPAGGWKIIAIDNASTDATTQVLESFAGRLPIVVTHCASKGKNSALNSALPLVDGDLVIFTDDDILPAVDWLTSLKKAADENPDYDIFGGAIEPDWPHPPAQWIIEQVHLGVTYALTDPALPTGEISPKQIWGPNMMVRGRVFSNGHRFSESIGPRAGTSYIMGSETEFTTRLAGHGYRSWFTSEARVRHMIRPEQMDREWILGRALRYGRTTAMNEFRNGKIALGGFPFGTPRWIYRAIASNALHALLRGAWFKSPASFRHAWQAYYYLGGLMQLRELRSMDASSRSRLIGSAHER